MPVVYRKLVRDRIPEIIQSEGRHPVTRVLDDGSYRRALLAKLATEDHMIPPSAQRAMAQRVGATAVDVAASHVVCMSQPAAVQPSFGRCASSVSP
jgi:hypothetical protein